MAVLPLPLVLSKSAYQPVRRVAVSGLVRGERVRAVGGVPVADRIAAQRLGAGGGVAVARRVEEERVEAGGRVLAAFRVPRERVGAGCGVLPAGGVGGERQDTAGRVSTADGIDFQRPESRCRVARAGGVAAKRQRAGDGVVPAVGVGEKSAVTDGGVGGPFEGRAGVLRRVAQCLPAHRRIAGRCAGRRGQRFPPQGQVPGRVVPQEELTPHMSAQPRGSRRLSGVGGHAVGPRVHVDSVPLVLPSNRGGVGRMTRRVRT